MGKPRRAVRPFFPGPFVIVNDDLKERRVVGMGVEEGPLTEAEKSQFMPPKADLRVRAANIAATQRRDRYREHVGATKRGYTPPRGWRP